MPSGTVCVSVAASRIFAPVGLLWLLRLFRCVNVNCECTKVKKHLQQFAMIWPCCRKDFSQIEGALTSGVTFYEKLKARALKGLRDNAVRSIYWKVRNLSLSII